MSDFTRIKLRRSDSSSWNNSNPILDLGEAGYETDFKRLKIGDGISSWSGLDYVRVHPSSISYPTISLSVGDGYDQRYVINLSNNQPLNIKGSGDTSVIYDDDTITIYSQAGLSLFNKYNVINALGYVPQISGNYSLYNHNHTIANISGLQTILDNKQTSGNYADANHTHLMRIAIADGTVLNYNANEILNIVGSGYTSILRDDYTNTLTIYSQGNSGVLSFNNRSGIVNLNYTDVTGALNYVPQPVGNYAISGHTHTVSDIIDFASVTNIPQRTPLSSTASGNPGDICWDIYYLYICVNTNFWRRIPHSSW